MIYIVDGTNYPQLQWMAHEIYHNRFIAIVISHQQYGNKLIIVLSITHFDMIGIQALKSMFQPPPELIIWFLQLVQEKDTATRYHNFVCVSH